MACASLLHDDAGPISNADSAYIRNWFSPLGFGKETDTRFLLATSVKTKYDVADLSWQLILDDFEQLAGPRAPGEWGLLPLFTTSDLEYCCNDLGLSHYNANECCFFCGANTTTISHNNYHRAAGWRFTIRNDAEFLVALRRPLHPVVAHSWFSRLTHRLDLLHLFDHHGAASHITANISAKHIRRASAVLPGATQEDRLDFLNDDIRGFYSADRVEHRMPRLKLANLYKEGFPELHGQAVKAANTRALVPYVKNLQPRAVAFDGSLSNKHALKVVDSLDESYRIMYSAGYFLQEQERGSTVKVFGEVGEQLSNIGCPSAGR